MTTDRETLKAQQAAAFAAWQGCPASRKAEKARLQAELDAAAKAVAAAKRAAEPVEQPVDSAALSARVAAHNALAAQAGASAEIERSVRWAARIYGQAQQFPRQGQGWPQYPDEHKAAAILREHADVAERLYGMGWEE